MKVLKPLLVTVSLFFACFAQAQICANNAQIAQLGNEVEVRLADFDRLLKTKPERNAVLQQVATFAGDTAFFNDLVMAEASCDRVVHEFQDLVKSYTATRQILWDTHHPDRTQELITAWNFVKVRMADLDLAVYGRSLDDEDSDNGPRTGGNGGGGGGGGGGGRGPGDDNGDRSPAGRGYY